jgi:putative spermidine/putrescine transport system ATP-binding protein
MFVADFVGTSNVLSGAAAERISGIGRPFSIRPERIQLAHEPVDDPLSICVVGYVRDIQYHGASSRVQIALADGTVLVASTNNDVDGSLAPAIDESIYAIWSRAAMVVLEPAIP